MQFGIWLQGRPRKSSSSQFLTRLLRAWGSDSTTHIHDLFLLFLVFRALYHHLGGSIRPTDVALASAHQNSGSSISAADARREATIVETKIYDEALSSEDYERICEKMLSSFDSPARSFSTDEDDDIIPAQSGLDVGKYKNATYHREGLFSVIYKAGTPKDAEYVQSNFPSSRGLVALKVTTPSVMEPPHDSKREVRILQLSASDRVIPLFESFREAGTRFVLVLPFMTYDFDHLLQAGKLSKEQVRKALRDLFTALAFIHDRGIIHRDVKPSNILIDSLDGPAYLSDFGIAWAPDTAGSEAAGSKITDVGTTCYRPPELLFGNKQYGCCLDLWAAGCTVAEAVVSGHPTLFDSGELGSDLALIQSTFSKLGTPNLTVWPEAATFPDWGKVQFHEYPPQPWLALLPSTSKLEQDLVSKLVRYESGARLCAAQVLQHPYFVA